MNSNTTAVGQWRPDVKSGQGRWIRSAEELGGRGGLYTHAHTCVYNIEECQYRGSHIPSGGPAVSIRVINFVWELGKWRINELAGGIMCAGTEKGVRERNLWAPGKSQLSARRTPRAHILGCRRPAMILCSARACVLCAAAVGYPPARQEEGGPNSNSSGRWRREGESVAREGGQRKIEGEKWTVESVREQWWRGGQKESEKRETKNSSFRWRLYETKNRFNKTVHGPTSSARNAYIEYTVQRVRVSFFFTPCPQIPFVSSPAYVFLFLFFFFPRPEMSSRFFF